MIRKKQFDYFAAMKDIAHLSHEAATALQTSIADYDYESFIVKSEAVHEIEHQGDTYANDIYEQLAVTFMTPIDREDIALLTDVLDDVLDGINEFTYLLENLVIRELRSGVREFIETIVAATEAVEVATGEFSKFKNSKKLKEHVKTVKTLEKGADRLYSEMTKELYTHEKDAIEIIKWRDVYNKLEKIVNDAESCVKVIKSLVIKNS
ncbi:phosphate transport regulator [Bacilli bacterium]|nr:phosphate transport regulator [Bacilli bacterium]GHU40821.1 phosphate transport regulator [Bacilli bacterium]GHU45122.1 phosphate transport regulator [Bacilli bacterium]